MASPRVFLPGAAPDSGVLTLEGAALRHLRALRLRVGDRVVAFDGAGREYDAVLTSVGRHRASATVEHDATVDRESPLDLVLAPAVLQGTRMDHVFEKGTELGVTRFMPVVTERVQGRPDHRERWGRIVTAAATQSGRTRIPTIDAPRPFTDALAAGRNAVLVVAWEGASAPRLADTPAAADRVVAITGPEGGLTPDEAVAAHAAGAHLIGLGPRLLRAETAAVALAVLVQARWGDG